MTDITKARDRIGDIQLRAVALEFLFDEAINSCTFPSEEQQKERTNAICEAFMDVCRVLAHNADEALKALNGSEV